MTIARRSKRSFSSTEKEWDDEDVGYELAWDEMLVEDNEARCSGCGIRPDEMFAPGGRPGREKFAENTPWKLEVRKCPFCEEVEELNHKANNTDGKTPWKPRPPRAFWSPRLKGQPVIPQLDAVVNPIERIRQGAKDANAKRKRRKKAPPASPAAEGDTPKVEPES